MKHRKKQKSPASKVFCFVVMLTTIISFFWLAFYSLVYHENKTLSEADIIAIIEAKKGNGTSPKPVKLYRPKTEAERLKTIAAIWNIKGTKEELKIFTARK